MNMDDRKLVFLASSLDDLKKFPLDAKREAGFQLGLVQQNLDPKDWKPFSVIGPGVKEPLNKSN